MIINKNIDLIYNINTLICLPIDYEKELETYEYNFKYVYVFEPSYEEANNFIQFVKRNNIKEIIFVNYRLEYETIIDNLRNQVKIGVIMDKDLASITDEHLLIVHNAIVELYKNDKIDKLGILDKNLYEITKKEFKETYHLLLDEPQTNTVENNKSGVGIINCNEDPKHSYFNALSAVKMADKKANLVEISQDVKNFVKVFNIKNQNFKNENEVILNSELALYINFCNNNMALFFKSMDSGIPCILGNNDILTKNEYLKSQLQVKSDDDINEISEKIDTVLKNKEKIFEEYKKFRKQYTELSKKSINQFVCKSLKQETEKDYEKLLTIGIPVYNVEQYIGPCIESVIEAMPKDAEIIIVNDGSTDNSEKEILKYKEKYPEIITYIKQENHGLGNVRNVIMQNSKGKYISSIDSDDTINKEFYKEALPSLENDVDIVLCDWLSIFKDSGKYPTEAMDNNLTLESNYKKLLYSTIMPSNCNKIVKKDIYQNIELKFIEGLKFEDLGTNPIIMNKAETIKYINKPYYEYNIRENSIMRTKVGYNMIDVLKILEDRINKYIEGPFNKNEFMAYVFFWRVEESILNQLYTLEKKERKDMIEYIYKNVKHILEQLYKNNEYVDELINRVDDETKDYIIERNKYLLDGKIEEFLDKRIKENKYKILTPALILYNYDNREK